MLFNIQRILTNIWPTTDEELRDLQDRGYLRGTILNLGAGWDDIAHLIDGTLVNQDIPWPDESRTNIDIFSPADRIPRADSTFDAILCLAVLEAVPDPERVVQEMRRVLKPRGCVIASVSFLQPEHKCPTDYRRYTKDGLIQLFEKHGFDVEEVKPLFTVYHTLHWIIRLWLLRKNSLTYRFLRLVLLVPLAIMAKRSTLTSDRVASAFRIVARKPAPSP